MDSPRAGETYKVYKVEYVCLKCDKEKWDQKVVYDEDVKDV